MEAERDMQELHPLISEAIKDGGQFVLVPKGVSMLPTIVPLKDSIVLVEPENLQKNDIVLYKRNNGMYVAHRIIKIKDGEYIICGDNQTALEYGVRRPMIIAKVDRILKEDGRVVDSQQIRSKGNFLIELRRVKRRIINCVKRLLHPVYKLMFKKKR